MVSRSYSDRTLKLLWGRSAGRCAVPECRIELFADATEYDPIVVIGEIAHMAAAADGGPRAEVQLEGAKRNDYDNLILLCQNCHAVIDGQSGSYPVERIKLLKTAHELWVRNSLPERGKSRTGWSGLSLRGDHPMDLATANAAISPDFIRGKIQELRIASEPEDWAAVRNEIAGCTQALLAGADPFDFRLAVFPLAPVSACISLGYDLTNRPHVKLFQYHRDDRSWAWPNLAMSPPDLFTDGLDEADLTCTDVVFAFHLSATVRDEDFPEIPGHAPRVHVRAAQPATDWLKHPAQLRNLASASRYCFERAHQQFPNASRWHILYAGPAPGGVAVGQQCNPTTSPAVHLYEFRAQRTPPYWASIVLGGAAV